MLCSWYTLIYQGGPISICPRVHFDYLIKAISARLCHIPVTLFLFVMNQYLLGKYFETRLVTTFLPRSKRLLNSWLQSPSTLILEPRKIKSATVATDSPSICREVAGHCLYEPLIPASRGSWSRATLEINSSAPFDKQSATFLGCRVMTLSLGD